MKAPQCDFALTTRIVLISIQIIPVQTFVSLLKLQTMGILSIDRAAHKKRLTERFCYAARRRFPFSHSLYVSPFLGNRLILTC